MSIVMIEISRPHRPKKTMDFCWRMVRAGESLPDDGRPQTFTYKKTPNRAGRGGFFSRKSNKMKHLFIKELGFKDHHLVKRRPDGAEEILYQGCSHEECLFARLRYESSHPSASEERVELPEKFMGFDFIHVTNRPPHA